MAKLRNIIIIIVAVFIIAVVGSGVYLSIELSHIKIVPPPPPVVVPTALSSYVSYQALLDYDNALYVAPYVGVSYNIANMSNAYFNATVLKSPFPSHIYLLNASTSGCVNCGDFSAFASGIQSYMRLYGLGSEVGNLTIINESFLPSIKNDSILIVPNGLMPSAMLSDYGNGSITLIHYLLDKGTSIVYIGEGFSSVVLQNGVIVPNTRIPSYMLTTSPSSSNSIFAFDSPTFSFTSGKSYGPVSYTNAFNGSIVAFSNYLNSWPTPSDAASDMAKAVSTSFWLPSYAYGTANVTVNASKSTSGSIGIEMLNPRINYTYLNAESLSNGFLHIRVYTNKSYGTANKSIYTYINQHASYVSNGTIALPTKIILGSPQSVTMQIYTHSTTPITIQPHLSIYTSNMVKVSTIPLSAISASGNYTFVKLIKSSFSPGEYIMQLKGFSDNIYASALFNVPPINITETYSNYTSSRFNFYLDSDGTPLTNLAYTITLNKKYPLNGTLTNGSIDYALPKGVGEQFGKLNFSVQMESKNYSYVTSNPAPVIRITSKDIALIIAVVLVLLLVTMIKAPNRDDFFIDVPHMPKQQKTYIELNPQEVVSSFQKLNTYYHWRYMPLSTNEVKLAIASNIRYNGIPVNLTISNVEILLDQLVANGMLLAIDNLYAPSNWATESKHDIEYLATFKKLRLYMVTHAHVFTDLDISQTSDMEVVINNERNNIIIYAQSSKYKNIPVSANSKTYIAFINDDKLEDFKDELYSISDPGAEQLKLYISAGYVKLISMEDATSNLFD